MRANTYAYRLVATGHEEMLHLPWMQRILRPPEWLLRASR